MYQFILNMWFMKKADETYVRACAAKGYLTQQEMDAILITPQLKS
ncbi:hypothetical protein EC917_101263 [Bacillus thuringiensis]|uniref:XkdX family protein n=1 Tax=Bacillus thuringiensis TaxID=1428 RepID=A0A4R4BKR8_BACTU|nr:hypothetical protein [Bacillus thuringiensis]TCW59009.1 hypothetical protein EC917_101263 [Bacillus thuringiensis]TCW59751.1 hypothetical protein EC910_101381 [Bacillus thuringiensis]